MSPDAGTSPAHDPAPGGEFQEPGRIRVLVCDDHPVVRVGLLQVLSLASDLAVVGEAVDGVGVLEHARLSATDVLLLDLAMPGLDGLAVLDELDRRRDAPRTLVLTSIGDDERIVRAIEAGARGCLFKDAQPQEILDAIRDVAQGRTVLGPAAATSLVRVGRSRTEPAVSLTPREREILQLVAVGTGNAAIGRRLFISEATVKTHLQHVYAKLGASDRAHAVTRARDLGLL